MGGILAIILLMVICETSAISSVKKYHNEDGTHYLVIAVMFYAVLCYLLSLALNEKSHVGNIISIWAGMSVFMVTMAGILFFEEELHVHDVFAGSLIASGILILKYTK